MRDERGASLVGYALLVVLVAMTGLGAMRAVGQNTSDSFGTVASEMTGGDDQATIELTPEEKWEKAQDDFAGAKEDAKARKNDTINRAKQERDDRINDAKADYKAAKQQNKSLDKNARKKADKEAKKTYNQAKKSANTEFNKAKKSANQQYKSDINTAKSDYNVAKADYKAWKKSK